MGFVPVGRVSKWLYKLMGYKIEDTKPKVVVVPDTIPKVLEMYFYFILAWLAEILPIVGLWLLIYIVWQLVACRGNIFEVVNTLTNHIYRLLQAMGLRAVNQVAVRRRPGSIDDGTAADLASRAKDRDTDVKRMQSAVQLIQSGW